jgi:hypothetical protein
MAKNHPEASYFERFFDPFEMFQLIDHPRRLIGEVFRCCIESEIDKPLIFFSEQIHTISDIWDRITRRSADAEKAWENPMNHKVIVFRLSKLALITAPALCGFNACTSMDIQNAFRSGITATLNSLFGVLSNTVANGIVG